MLSTGTAALRKILYVAMRYDYGKPAQGTSFEFNNFYSTLLRMVPNVVEFDFMSMGQQLGRAEMNRRLLQVVEEEKPDLVFFVLFTDEIAEETIAAITRLCVTFNWFCDDHWRFESFSRHFAPHFTFVSTTDSSALPKYQRIGYQNVIVTQWACNHYDYVALPGVEKKYDVTFVGQPHGSRRSTIGYLARHGIRVDAFGQGWERGRVSQEEMIRVFNESRINLNLSNSSWNIHSLLRGRQQIKGRNFEVPGCGGFLMTNYVGGLENYYAIGEEIICFRGRRELLEGIRYYLNHESDRENIARKGYLRTLRDHTYENRFRQIFARMGFAV
jgi:spore maturation protein CgeB